MKLLDALFGDPRNPNLRLEKLFAELARANLSTTRELMFRELLSSSLLLASPAAVARGQAEGPAVAGEATEVRFVAGPGPDGGKAMLAFTGDEALLQWRAVGCDTIALKVPDLCALARSSGCAWIAVNPCGPSGGWIGPSEIKALAEGRVPDVLGRKETVPTASLAVRRPSREAPAALVEALRRQAESQPEVRAVYLVEADLDGEAKLLVGVAVDAAAAPDRVVPAFIERTLRRLNGASMPDVLLAKDGDAISAAGTPVFRRE